MEFEGPERSVRAFGDRLPVRVPVLKKSQVTRDRPSAAVWRRLGVVSGRREADRVLSAGA